MSSAKHVEIAWRHGEGSGEGFALASRSSATPTMRTRHPVASSARAPGHAHDAVVREQPHPSTCWRELSCVVEVVCRVHARWYSVLTHWPVVVSVCRVWEVDAKLRHSQDG